MQTGRTWSSQWLFVPTVMLVLGLISTSALLVRSATPHVHPLAPAQAGMRLDTFFVVSNTSGQLPYGLYHKWSDNDGSTWSGLAPLGRPGNGTLDYLTVLSAVSDAPGHLELFALAGTATGAIYNADEDLLTSVDSSLYTNVFDQGQWSGWVQVPWAGHTELGYLLSSAPATTSWGPGRMELFIYGRNPSTGDMALLHTWADNGHWSGNWEVLSTGDMRGIPAAVSPQAGRDDVFMRGLDGQLSRQRFVSGSWLGKDNLGGNYLYSPAVASWSPNHLDLIVVGTDHVPYRKWTDDEGTTWSSWVSLGGATFAEPAAVSPSTGRLHVFMRGTDDRPYVQSFNNSTGFGWVMLDTNLTAAPAVAAWVLPPPTPTATPRPPTPTPTPFPRRCPHLPCPVEP
ncbi:MAG: hypothetical protein H0U76_07475 [Ktedonobacteraceae bacterium]|nr:hypothetical protein [Ktedonobacteraceae bacterium]